MPNTPDPRVFFAAERTLLAWIRTGIALIGLGFVVARFGLFLRFTVGFETDHRSGELMIIGTAMTVLGALASAGAAIRYTRFVRSLAAHQRPAHWSTTPPTLFAWTLATSGLVLAVYLVI